MVFQNGFFVIFDLDFLVINNKGDRMIENIIQPQVQPLNLSGVGIDQDIMKVIKQGQVLAIASGFNAIHVVNMKRAMRGQMHANNTIFKLNDMNRFGLDCAFTHVSSQSTLVQQMIGQPVQQANQLLQNQPVVDDKPPAWFVEYQKEINARFDKIDPPK